MKLRHGAELIAMALVASVASTASGQPAPASNGVPSAPQDSVPSSESPPPSPPPQAPNAQPAAPWSYTPTASAPPAAPPAEPEFGDRGEYVISGSFNVSLGHLAYGSSGASTTSVIIQPSFDYFIGKNYLMGGAIFLSHADSVSGFGVESSSIAYGAYVRIGGNVPFGRLCSWRPVASIGAWSQHLTVTAPAVQDTNSIQALYGGQSAASGTTGSDISETVVVAEFFAPLLVHPVRHFFLGLGPDIYADLSHTIGTGEDNRTFIGVSTVVGGWFGGEPEKM
jgi:hypothetical protein